MANFKISTRLLMLISILSMLLVAIQIADVDSNIATKGKVWAAYRVAPPTPILLTVRSRVVTTQYPHLKAHRTLPAPTNGGVDWTHF